MKYSDPANLVVIACPGGEAFADAVVFHLKRHYHHRFTKAVSDIAAKYALDPNAVTAQISLIKDVTNLYVKIAGPQDEAMKSRFKVPAQFTLFANGEIKAEILESIRGKDIYIVQDMENHFPLTFKEGIQCSLTVNDHLMTLLVTVDAVKQAGAGRITLVLPIYPYSRQHKKKGREGVTASSLGYIFESLGVSRIITLDIHSRDIGNAFNKMRLENLHASYQIIRELSQLAEIQAGDFVVVSPDTGAVDRNKFYATTFKKPLALLYKERDYSRLTKNALENNITALKLLGDVKGMTVFMADDMLGTGGTLLKAIEYFDSAYREGLFYRIIGTNAIYQETLLDREWYISVDISKLFAKIISRLYQSQPLSPLLDNRDIINKLLTE